MFLEVFFQDRSDHNTMTKKQKPTEKLENAIIVGPMPFAKKLISPSWKGQLIFVDGGLLHQKDFKQKGPKLYQKSFSLGDGDSAKRGQLQLHKHDQNLSDLAFCLQQLQAIKDLKTMTLLGFLGGRKDHELINLGEIASFLRKRPDVRVFLDDQIEFLPPGKHQFTFKGTFSLASFTPNQIKIEGDCRYPLKKWTKLEALSSLGLSNEASGLVTVECKKTVMLFLCK